MPQMAPLMWTTLFAVFTLLYMLASVKMYYSQYQMNNVLATSGLSTDQELQWKW